MQVHFQLVDIKVVDKLPPHADISTPRTGRAFVEALVDANASEAKASEERASARKAPFAKNGGGEEGPVVLLFGREASGSDVLLRVEGFRPYLDYVCSAAMIGRLQAHVMNSVRYAERKWFEENLKAAFRVRSPQKKLYGWHPSETDVDSVRTFEIVRVFFPSTRARSAVVKNAETEPLGFELVEAKVSSERQFTDLHDLNESGWVQASVKKVKRRISHCTSEYVARVEDLSHFECDDIAPLRVCSFDIECSSASGGFPQSSTDAVVAVGLNFWNVGTPVTEEHIERHALCLDSCDPVEGVILQTFETEYDLLDAMRDVVVHQSPDVMVGYNIFGFDWRFLCDRAAYHRCQRFFYMSKLLFVECAHSEKNLSSGALGDNVMYVLERTGGVAHDLFMTIKAEHKLTSYKLDSVAEHFTGQRKDDLAYSTLFAAWKPGSTSADRARVVKYCARDCDLPLVLADTLKMYISMVEMSRVTHTQIRDLVLRGQQIKVYQQVLHFAHRMGYVMNAPSVPPPEGDFQGATVVDPKSGFYTEPVAVLDFMSLYPSIMRWKNLCYCTYVVNAADAERDGARIDTYTFETDSGERYQHQFSRNAVGVLPEVLRHLLDERKRTKARMKRATTQLDRDILDKRQLAIKVSCNSVYGFTGVTKGMYPLRAIAESVTRVGRELIDQTIRLCETHERAEVVYGDTDSVMIRFVPALSTWEEVFERSERLAAHITEQFAAGGEHIIVLEFEKVMHPFLLLERKRYACMAYEALGKPPKRDVKGLPTVRRDNTPIARTVLQDVLSGLLEHCSIAKAEELLETHLDSLRHNTFEFSQYVQSRSLKSSYKAPEGLAQCRTVAKMRERNPGSEPRPGDRVEFVITEGRSPKVADRAEDPAYARDKGVPVDRLYILENQIENIVTKVFGRVGGTRHKALIDACRRDLVNQKNKQGCIVTFLRSRGAAPTPLMRRRRTR